MDQTTSENAAEAEVTKKGESVVRSGECKTGLSLNPLARFPLSLRWHFDKFNRDQFWDQQRTHLTMRSSQYTFEVQSQTYSKSKSL